VENSFKKILEEAKKQKRIVSIFLDTDDLSSCSVGFVNEVTNEYTRLDSVSPNGESAGQEIKPLDEIFRIDFGGLYEKKIELLYNNRGKIYEELSSKSPSEESLIMDTIKQAKTNNLVVELWSEDDDNSILGYVESVEKSFVKILAVDEYGRNDGIVYIKTETVRCMDCGTIRCQKIKFLHEKQ
jgi:hypothetical protein